MHNSAVDLIPVLIACWLQPADGWPLLRLKLRYRFNSSSKNGSPLLTLRHCTRTVSDNSDSPTCSSMSAAPAGTAPSDYQLNCHPRLPWQQGEGHYGRMMAEELRVGGGEKIGEMAGKAAQKKSSHLWTAPWYFFPTVIVQIQKGDVAYFI